MITAGTINIAALVWVALALVLLPVQLRITAPYGRHHRAGFGPDMASRTGWIIMEAVSLAVFVALFLTGSAGAVLAIIPFVLWIAHYAHRSFVYPLRAHMGGRRIPLLIVGSAISFNAVNAGLNGIWLGAYGLPYTSPLDVRFVIGLIVFAAGAAINVWADNRLIALRRDNGASYTTPHGGLFERVSCPNHLGEIVEWTGFAILCWNLPALSFAVWTAANLLPRALDHHRWYRQRFPDYPVHRRAVLPFVL